MLQVGAAGEWGERLYRRSLSSDPLDIHNPAPVSSDNKITDIIVDQIPFPRSGLQIQGDQTRDSLERGRIGEEELREGTHLLEKSDPTSSPKKNARKKLTSRPLSCPSAVVPISLAASDSEPHCGSLPSIAFVIWPSLLCRSSNQNLLFSLRKRLRIISSHCG
jgi:hypothetical protein